MQMGRSTVVRPMSSFDSDLVGAADGSGEPTGTLHHHEPSTTEEHRNPWQNLQEWKATLDADEVINMGILLGIGVLVWVKLTTIEADFSRGWTLEEQALRIPLDVWASYSEVLDRAPVMTKAATSATVYTIGDVIAQRTGGASMGDLDRMRTLRSMLAGLLGHGPLSHYWYNFCDNIFDNTLQWTAWWAFFPKILVDQTTWGPFWNNTYILLLGLMKMEKLPVIWADMKRTTVPLIVSGLKLWPLAHCVTYGLVPTENRLLWVDLVEILWVTILASQASGAAATSPEASAESDAEIVVAVESASLVASKDSPQA
jgi:protein Mpv17